MTYHCGCRHNHLANEMFVSRSDTEVAPASILDSLGVAMHSPHWTSKKVRATSLRLEYCYINSFKFFCMAYLPFPPLTYLLKHVYQYDPMDKYFIQFEL